MSKGDEKDPMKVSNRKAFHADNIPFVIGIREKNTNSSRHVLYLRSIY